jgi:hypothetical protein
VVVVVVVVVQQQQKLQQPAVETDEAGDRTLWNSPRVTSWLDHSSSFLLISFRAVVRMSIGLGGGGDCVMV